MKEKGKLAETTAKHYLLNNGLILLKQNFYSRFGEIDLIMFDRSDSAIIFIEVKERKAGFAEALESITVTKQRKLVKTAQYYITKINKNHDYNYRFDAVVIDATTKQLQWLKNVIYCS